MSSTPFLSVTGRAVSVRLMRCAACGESAPQKTVRAEQVDLQSVPGRPFARAFAWKQGVDAPAESPLWFGLALCPECRYPALYSDYEAQPGDPNGSAALERIFVAQMTGASGPLAALLGPAPELAPPAVRALRVNLAAIAVSRLQSPSARREQTLARLYARLVWYYLDLLHLVWEPGPRRALAGWTDRGCGAGAVAECLATLELQRAVWPEIPLDEESARVQAVAAQESFCRVVAERDPGPEQAEELRGLALLRGLTGDVSGAKAAYREALERCRRGAEAHHELYRSGREAGAEPEELHRSVEQTRRFLALLEDLEREAALTAAIEPGRPLHLRLPSRNLPGLDETPRLLGLFG